MCKFFYIKNILFRFFSINGKKKLTWDVHCTFLTAELLQASCTKSLSNLTFENGISSNPQDGSLINPSIPPISSCKFRRLEIGYCFSYSKYFQLEGIT